MFATLAGGYPATDPGSPPDRPVDELVRAVLAEQAEAGLALLTDGSVRWPDPLEAIGRMLLRPDRAGHRRDGPLTVDAWTFAADAADGVPVKQCLPGPYSLGRRFAEGEAVRADLTRAFADALAVELVDLAGAGCPFIQVDEPAAVSIGSEPAEQTLFREAQARLLDGLGPTSDRPHLSLAITGGNADLAGAASIFAAPYDSHLFDLIAGPDNWRLVTVAPAERGIVSRRCRCPLCDRRRARGHRVGRRLRGGQSRSRRGADRDRPVGQPGGPAPGGGQGQDRSPGRGRRGWSTGGPRNPSPPRSTLGPWTCAARHWAAGRRQGRGILGAFERRAGVADDLRAMRDREPGG